VGEEKGEDRKGKKTFGGREKKQNRKDRKERDSVCVGKGTRKPSGKRNGQEWGSSAEQKSTEEGNGDLFRKRTPDEGLAKEVC